MCKEWAKEVYAWDKELREWQEAFNREVLLSKGVFMKSQSYCFVTRGEKGEKHRHISRWLSFALTPEHIALLREEPSIFGDVEGGCWGGPDESRCAIHP